MMFVASLNPCFSKKERALLEKGTEAEGPSRALSRSSLSFLVTNLEGAVPASHHPPPPHLVAPRGARLRAAQPHPAVAHGRLERCYRGRVRSDHSL